MYRAEPLYAKKRNIYLTKMKSIFLVPACLCVLAFAVAPSQALTFKSLTVNIGETGDAQVDLQYELSLPEQAAVIFQVTDLRTTLENDLRENLNKPVSVENAGLTSSRIRITGFAGVVEKDGNRVMQMPAFSFANAERVMKRYWYAPLTSADFSPSVTTIVFPDGYTEYYYDQISIPSITRTL